MDITAEEVRSLENMDAEDGGVGEGGDVVRVDDSGAGDAVVRGPGGIDGGGAGCAIVRGPGGINGGSAGDAIVMGGDDRGRGRGDRGRGREDRGRGDRGRGRGDRRGGEVNFYAEYIHVYYSGLHREKTSRGGKSRVYTF